MSSSVAAQNKLVSDQSWQDSLERAIEKSGPESNKKLSRKKRFLIPDISTWSVQFRFLLIIPLSTVPTSVIAWIPFTFSLSTLM